VECRKPFKLTEGARISGFMITAYILIATTMGEEKAVAEKLAEKKEVEVADILYGEWDIILRVKIENLTELDSFLTRTIRKMKNIKLTSTLIAS
jgi:DNA-binding Lrp family transcriptional regulator